MSKTVKRCKDKTKLVIWNKQVVSSDELQNKEWFFNGNLHRDNGPAVEFANGGRVWYVNGKRHRENGPAIEWDNGDKGWYLNGKYYSESDYWKELRK